MIFLNLTRNIARIAFIMGGLLMRFLGMNLPARKKSLFKWWSKANSVGFLIQLRSGIGSSRNFKKKMMNDRVFNIILLKVGQEFQ